MKRGQLLLDALIEIESDPHYKPNLSSIKVITYDYCSRLGVKQECVLDKDFLTRYHLFNQCPISGYEISKNDAGFHDYKIIIAPSRFDKFSKENYFNKKISVSLKYLVIMNNGLLTE